ncbi:MAG TPA: hypothetical protein VJ783_01810 [Pirellulales bacterium]|nr:hypothetical protein [Pirellulales bacterium]
MPDWSSSLACCLAVSATRWRRFCLVVLGFAPAGELALPLQLQFQADLCQLPLELLVFGEQFANLLTFEVQLAMQHFQVLTLVAGRINEG